MNISIDSSSSGAPLPAPGLAMLFDALIDLDPDCDGSDHPGLVAAREHGFDAIEFAAAGGIAEVWRGTDQNTGKDIAIKVARRNQRQVETAAIHVLEQEADILGRLSVQGVVPLLRRGGEGPSRFLVVPWIDGDSIDTYAARLTDTVSLKSLCKRFVETIQGLHEAGFAHGDLKPANVLIDPLGDVNLIDLAFASKLDNLQSNDLPLTLRGGTPGYTPVKKSQARSAGNLDLYAIAIVLDAMTEPHEPLNRLVVRETAAWLDLQETTETVSQLQRLNESLEVEHGGKRGRAAMLSIATIILAVACWVGLQGRTGQSSAIDATGHSKAPRWAGVMSAIEGGRLEDARLVLNEVDEGAKNWAWRHLWMTSTEPPASSHHSFHTEHVSSTARPSNGVWAVGSWRGRVAIEGPTGPRWAKDISTAVIRYVTWSRDHRRLLVCDRAGRLAELDATSGDILREVRIEGVNPTIVQYAPSGRIHTLAMDGRLIEVDLDSGAHEQLSRHDGVIFPTSSRKHWLTVDKTDGDSFLLSLVEDGKGNRWKHTSKIGAAPLAMDVHADTGRIAVGFTDGTVLIGEVGSDEVDLVRAEEGGYVSAVVFDEYGDVVLAAGENIHIINVPERFSEFLLDRKIPGIVTAAAWDPVDQTFSVQTHKGISLWQAIAPSQVASR